jgi:hypothetical protein
MCLPQRKATSVEGGGIPGGVVQAVVQLLAITPGNQGGEHRHGLVLLSRQEQADQVLAKGLARRPTVEQVIELGQPRSSPSRPRGRAANADHVHGTSHHRLQLVTMVVEHPEEGLIALLSAFS